MKKVVWMLLYSVILSFTMGSHVFAAQTHYYDVGRLPQLGTYDGFWLQGELPILNPDWTSGTENKINYEFWFNINNNSSQWVEMGYHVGYAFNTDGSPKTSSYYDGLFTAKYDSSWRVDTFNSKFWSSGQTHTMGNEIWPDPVLDITHCDMRTDNSVIITYSNVSNSNTGTIDAGLEYGREGSVTQYVSTPTYMSSLNVLDNGTWKTWSSVGGVSLTDDGATGYIVSWEAISNRLKFW